MVDTHNITTDAVFKNALREFILAHHGRDLRDAKDWIRGRALATNPSIDKMLVGGMRIDHQYNSLGDGLVNADASINGKAGSNFVANLGKPNNMNQANAQEIAELAMNPKKLAPLFAGKTYNWVKSHLEALGMDEDTADKIASSVTAGGTAIVAAGGVELLQTLFNKANGRRVATNDFSYKDAEGEIRTILAGKKFTLSDIPKEYRKLAFENLKTELGIVRKFIDNNWKKDI